MGIIEIIVKGYFYRQVASKFVQITLDVVEALRDTKDYYDINFPEYDWPDELYVVMPNSHVGFDLMSTAEVINAVFDGVGLAVASITKGAWEVVSFSRIDTFLDGIDFPTADSWPVAIYDDVSDTYEVKPAGEWDPVKTPSIHDVINDIAIIWIVFQFYRPVIKALGEAGKMVLKKVIDLVFGVGRWVNKMISNKLKAAKMIRGIDNALEGDFDEILAEIAKSSYKPYGNQNIPE